MSNKKSTKSVLHKNLLLIIGIIVLLVGGLFLYQNEKPLYLISPDKSSDHASSGHYKAAGHTPVELNKLITSKNNDDYVVIDVRTKQEYDKGHVPGAVHADFYDTEALNKAAGDKTPIVYCTYSAMRGPYAAYQLYQSGKSDVRFLDGGIAAWAEDIQGMDSNDPNFKTVFKHPKNIFPERALNISKEAPLGDVSFTITATKYEFSPRVIKVKQGQRVTLNIISEDVVHGFAIPEFGIEEELPPHEEKTITFVADRKGNFPFVCNVICGVAHDHASMVGNLIVE